MAQFGGNKNSPWTRSGPQGGPAGPMDMQQAGLVAAAASMGAGGFAGAPPVFQQGMPHHPSQLGMGGHPPPVTLPGLPGQQVPSTDVAPWGTGQRNQQPPTMSSFQNVGAVGYPRPLGAQFGAAAAAAANSQQILQQQQQTAAAIVGVSLQQQQHPPPVRTSTITSSLLNILIPVFDNSINLCCRDPASQRNASLPAP